MLLPGEQSDPDDFCHLQFLLLFRQIPPHFELSFNLSDKN